jgi:hypothetical protein
MTDHMSTIPFYACTGIESNRHLGDQFDCSLSQQLFPNDLKIVHAISSIIPPSPKTNISSCVRVRYALNLFSRCLASSENIMLSH